MPSLACPSFLRDNSLSRGVGVMAASRRDHVHYTPVPGHKEAGDAPRTGVPVNPLPTSSHVRTTPLPTREGVRETPLNPAEGKS